MVFMLLKNALQWQVLRHGDPKRETANSIDQQINQANGSNTIMDSHPFHGIVARTLRYRDSIDLEGFIPDGAQVFSLNLVCDDKNDIAFHYKVDFVNDQVVQNCKVNGNWLDEQITGDVIFQQGAEMNMKLVMNGDEIYTYCNNMFHSMFRLQHPIEAIRYIQIWGDIERVNKLSFTFA